MNETIQANENQAPQLLEGVSELRKCNFAPQDHFIKIRFKNSDDESFYLEVKWREFWFHTFCTENGIFGSIIENDAALIAGTQFLQASAEVMMDGKVAGRGVGGYYLSGNDMEYAVQMAETIAKGRALANAGFGTVFTSASASENGGFEVPCDGGMRTSEFFVRSEKNPMQMVRNNNTTVPEEKPTAEKPKPEPVKADPQPAPAAVTQPENNGEKIPTTREEALRFRIPVRGKHFNEAFGDVMGKDPDAVRYYATNPRYAGKAVQAAAKLVLQT